MINLYLDDVRTPPIGYVLAKTVEEAIDIIENNQIDRLSLDHDLGEDEFGEIRKTGYDLVKYICEHRIAANAIFLHTSNPVGRDNMYETLVAAQRRGLISDRMIISRYPAR